MWYVCINYDISTLLLFVCMWYVCINYDISTLLLFVCMWYVCINYDISTLLLVCRHHAIISFDHACSVINHSTKHVKCSLFSLYY